MNYKDFMKTIKTENFAPVYLFYGVEMFIGELLIDNVIDKMISPGFEVFNYNLLKDREITAKEIVQTCNTMPLGSAKRIVVVKEEVGIFERHAEADIQELSAYLKDPSPSTVLIFTHDKGDKRRKNYQTIASKSVLEELDK